MDLLAKVENFIGAEDLESLRTLSLSELRKLGKLAPLSVDKVSELGLKYDNSARDFLPCVRKKLHVELGRNIFLARVSGDGNCLYNAASVAITGQEELSPTLRALTSAELYLNATYYASHPHFVSLLATDKTPGLIGRFFQLSHSFEVSDLATSNHFEFTQSAKVEALKNCQVKRWSPFICLLALASVIGIPIHSLYPETGGMIAGKYAAKLFNAIIHPRERLDDSNSHIHLLWSCFEDFKRHINPNFKPNHFVPVFVGDNFSLDSSNAKSRPSQTLNVAASGVKYGKSKSSVAASFSSLKQSKICFHSSTESSDNDFMPQVTSSPPVAVLKTDSALETAVTNSYDIGSFYGQVESFTEAKKYDLCKNVWGPDANFVFPSHSIYGSKRKFSFSWLNDYPWLRYSKALDGAFCLPCVIFGRRIGVNSSKVDKLVKSPFTDWSCAVTRFKSHCKSDIHKTSLLTMQTFLNVKQESSPLTKSAIKL
ncbi:uncharacterized protein LOC135694297 isoform X2 [Rhopilema esculentum]|uniref:uncharacterized protein LOC135694297 isoform X2 n=1 Tax=Rhopilema esculentum TaxID=499914 RepID=UPI0031DFBED7